MPPNLTKWPNYTGKIKSAASGRKGERTDNYDYVDTYLTLRPHQAELHGHDEDETVYAAPGSGSAESSHVQIYTRDGQQLMFTGGKARRAKADKKPSVNWPLDAFMPPERVAGADDDAADADVLADEGGAAAPARPPARSARGDGDGDRGDSFGFSFDAYGGDGFDDDGFDGDDDGDRFAFGGGSGRKRLVTDCAQCRVPGIICEIDPEDDVAYCARCWANYEGSGSQAGDDDDDRFAFGGGGGHGFDDDGGSTTTDLHSGGESDDESDDDDAARQAGADLDAQRREGLTTCRSPPRRLLRLLRLLRLARPLSDPPPSL